MGRRGALDPLRTGNWKREAGQELPEFRSTKWEKARLGLLPISEARVEATWEQKHSQTLVVIDALAREV
jgi:hypothetical protein